MSLEETSASLLNNIPTYPKRLDLDHCLIQDTASQDLLQIVVSERESNAQNLITVHEVGIEQQQNRFC